MGRDGFASLAHRLIVSQKKWAVKDLATSLEMSPESLYNRLLGRTPFHVEEARSLLGFAPDPELGGYLLALSPFTVAEKPVACDPDTNNLQKGATRMVLEAADILRAIESGVRDGHLDHIEKRKVQKEIVEAERVIASLKLLLDL